MSALGRSRSGVPPPARCRIDYGSKHSNEYTIDSTPNIRRSAEETKLERKRGLYGIGFEGYDIKQLICHCGWAYIGKLNLIVIAVTDLEEEGKMR